MPLSIPALQKTVLEWFEKNGRHDLPWRVPALKPRRDGGIDPYKVLVSEVMLQQTQVDRVIGYYRAFLKRFGTIRSLAQASPADVLRAWKGLGYNRRALNLQRACQMIVREFGGRFPRDVGDIEKLPGVGHYTARAVATFALNQPHVFIETNIRRVFIHFFCAYATVIPAKAGIHTKNKSGLDPALSPRGGSAFGGRRDDKRCSQDDGIVSDIDLFPFIEKALYAKNPRLWYSALMDYGALALSDIENPNRRSRHYTKQSRFEGSRRYVRAKILDFLLEHKEATTARIKSSFKNDRFFDNYRASGVFEGIVDDLAREGFIIKRGNRIFLPTEKARL